MSYRCYGIWTEAISDCRIMQSEGAPIYPKIYCTYARSTSRMHAGFGLFSSIISIEVLKDARKA